MPPQISRNQAEKVAQNLWNNKGAIGNSWHWERIRNGGGNVRTVWSVELVFQNPEGEVIEEVVIDADSVDVIEGESY